MKQKTNVRLFNQLMKLSENEGSKFYSKDMISGLGTKVRVFAYHIANYSDWLIKGATESRGIMFEIDDKGKPVRIMARPMEKFWNLNENPFTMNLDLTKTRYYMTKEDGSLITSFQDQGHLLLKSKTSLFSTQVEWSMEWLHTQPSLKARVLELAMDGYSVNFEYVGPKNRIVLGYAEPSLRILNIRNNDTGDYVEMDEIFADPILRPYMVDIFDSTECSDEWVSKVRKMEGIEGYILMVGNQFIKIKTDWYCALHHTKDSINSNRRLAEVCVKDAVDDLRGMFLDDKLASDKIGSFEARYHEVLTNSFDDIKDYVTNNIWKDRRQYAIDGMMRFKLTPHMFNICMKLYSGFDGEQCFDLIKIALLKNIDLIIPKEYI